MDKDTLIHNTLNQVDWDAILLIFKTLNLPFYDKKPTKASLANDLSSLIKNAIEEPAMEVLTEYWTVTYWNEEDREFLQISLTPICFLINSEEIVEDKLQKKILNLLHRIELHKKLEEYEKCGKYLKQLEKLESKVTK